MFTLERFTKGNPETLRKLNAIVNAVNKLNVMTGDQIIKVLRTSSGIVLNVDKDALVAGIPKTTGGDRKAFCKTDAGAATTLTCFLDTDTTGEEVEVQFTIAGGGNLEDCIPRLTDGLLIFVENFGGTWYHKPPMQKSKDCVCEVPA